MIWFFNWFVKITGYIVQKIVFRTKVYYENKSIQSKRIKGSAIIISNHTSVWDYAVFLFVFFFRTLRYQMAEVLFKKKFLGLFLRCMGGIYVNRDTHNFSFMSKSEKLLKKGKVVGVFPESRLPKPDEEKPLKFTPSVACLALSSGAKIVPVYTSGNMFSKKRVRVIIGEPITVADYYDESLSEKENIEKITEMLREKIIGLEKLLDEKSKKSKKGKTVLN